jgi:hypothetical protein
MLNRKFAYRLFLSVLSQLVIFGGLLLGPAGTFPWPRAWIFLVVEVLAAVVTMVLVFCQPRGFAR